MEIYDASITHATDREWDESKRLISSKDRAQHLQGACHEREVQA